ncbi:MAG TPA: hypothetical protein VFQ45_09145 [Longimicrobium sp.]|nr:hypothetical protein [Longimicrobium sp.]
MKPALIIALLSLGACAPIVTHGPQVSDGLQLNGTVGVPRELCDSCHADLIPQYGFGVRYGRKAEPGRFGISSGLTLSLAMFNPELDVYVEAPKPDGGWAYGGGVLAAMTHTMPYVQVGKLDPDGSGFYTTQGFALLEDHAEGWNLMPEDDTGPYTHLEPRYWAPTVAYRQATRRGAIHWYLSGAFGRAKELHYPNEFAPNPGPGVEVGSRPVRVIMLGVAFEHTLSMPRVGPQYH